MKSIVNAAITILVGVPVIFSLGAFLAVFPSFSCTDNYGIENDGKLSDEVKLSCDEALLLAPFNDSIRHRRVSALIHRDEYQGALEDYNWLILEGRVRRFFDSAQPSKESQIGLACDYLNRAVVQYKLADKPAAIKDYQIAQTISPEIKNCFPIYSGSTNQLNIDFWHDIGLPLSR